MSESGTPELVTIPHETAFQVFTTEGAIQPYLTQIRAVIDNFTADVSTAKGRKEIASVAYKVAQAKTYIENIGKDLAAEAKEIPKKIDACRKLARDTLDTWKDEVRKPLTDWEAAEDARVKKHTDALQMMADSVRDAPALDLQALKDRLEAIQAIVVGPECEEFEADYDRAKRSALDTLTVAIAKAEQAEKDKAELERLRKAEQDRIAKEQQEAAAKVAAEAATNAAQAAAQQQIADAQAVAAQAQRDKEAADLRAASAEAKAKKDLEDAKALEDAETARRAADKEHRGKINRAAAAAFMEGGLSEADAKKAVALIATGKIPAVAIQY